MNESPDAIDVEAVIPGPGQPLAQLEEAHGQLLREADPQEFLPSPDPWLRGAAWLMVIGFSAAAGLMAVWPYRLVVRGSGQVRPSGETSVIQAPFPARVSAVLVQPNQEVRGGQVLAQLDRSDLDGEHQQLRESRDALRRQAEAMQAEHQAARKAAHFYSMLQCDDGHWAGDYGGPHFLMPGLVSAWYVMGKPKEFLDQSQIQLLLRYILIHQQSDGGWGTHLESPSTMFGST